MTSCLLNNLGLMIITISFLLILIIPFAAPLSFNLTSFRPVNNSVISYELSYPFDNVIYLTDNSVTMGRATYAQPLHLWDRASGNLTDFTTHFSFVINSFNSTSYADGFAFFLAPNGSGIPQGTTKGGTIGLAPDSSPLNSAANPFVAVEFDIYSNDWDPIPNEEDPNVTYEHVGIDINSMKSLASVTWWSKTSIKEGLQHEAWISYNSQSMNLSVAFTGFRNGTQITDSLSYIVDLRDYLPEFVTFGFSATSGGTSIQHTILSWSCNSNLESIRVETLSDNPRRITGKSKSGLLIRLAVGVPISVLVLVLGLLMYFCLCKETKTGTNDGGDEASALSEICNQVHQRAGITKFAYDHLKEATNSFMQDNKLGQGGFGSVYKGFLKEIDSLIAVKRICTNSEEGAKGYVAEVQVISTLRHKNLVQLLGWCHEKKQELLLVYEFLPNGSLDSHLFCGESLLTWEIRFQIAKDLASALLYLHESWKQCVLHRDIKPGNVMLDADFNVKLGDFGLARLVDHEKGSDSTVTAGTPGYMAPELFEDSEATKETDVYSFGVVALEIATGKRAIHGDAKQGRVSLVEWARNLHQTGKLHDGADPKLASVYNWPELVRLMTVGLWCTLRNSNSRPSIKEAVRVLDGEAPLPELPLVMHVLTHSASSVDMRSHGAQSRMGTSEKRPARGYTTGPV